MRVMANNRGGVRVGHAAGGSNADVNKGHNAMHCCSDKPV